MLPPTPHHPWLAKTFCVPLFLAAFGVVNCSEGHGELTRIEDEHTQSNPGGQGGGAGAPQDTFPDQVPLALDENGEHQSDEFGLQGSWTSDAGPGSSITLSHADGTMCVSGQTAQVVDNDYGTYWGVSATLTLCAGDAGEPRPISECLGDAADEFSGLAFTLDGSAVPWLTLVTFEETGREDGNDIILQSEGEVQVFVSDARNYWDSEAPPTDPSQVEALTIRAAGSTDGDQSVAFCIRDVSMLFGEQWQVGEVPEWIDEPGPGRVVDWAGVNLVGAEFGESRLPGTYGADYIYPNADDINYYAGKGMNVFRVPFRWERLQRELYADLESTELGYLRDTVTAIKAAGGTVIIDPHNFARYDDDSTDNEEWVVGVDIDADALADLWAKIAAEFANDDQVWFGLMNEPHHMETEVWLDVANLAIAAIRDQGANNKVLVPGNEWSGAHAWSDNYYGTPNAEVMLNVVDPSDNFAFEVHQYFDQNNSGGDDSCVSETIGVERVQEFTAWLQDNGFQGFLGEFGGSTRAVCLGAVDNLLTYLGENPDVWLGWTVWASAEWSIQHNIHPVNGEDSLQMRVLMRHLDAP